MTLPGERELMSKSFFSSLQLEHIQQTFELLNQLNVNFNVILIRPRRWGELSACVPWKSHFSKVEFSLETETNLWTRTFDGGRDDEPQKHELLISFIQQNVVDTRKSNYLSVSFISSEFLVIDETRALSLSTPFVTFDVARRARTLDRVNHTTQT